MGYQEDAADYRLKRILATFDTEGFDEAVMMGYELGLSEEQTECILLSNNREFE